MHGGNPEFVQFVQNRLDDGINKESPEFRALTLSQGFEKMEKTGMPHPLMQDIVAAWQAYQTLENQEKENEALDAMVEKNCS